MITTLNVNNPVNCPKEGPNSSFLFFRFNLDVSRGGTLNMFECVNMMTIKAKQADYGIQVESHDLFGHLLNSLLLNLVF